MSDADAPWSGLAEVGPDGHDVDQDPTAALGELPASQRLEAETFAIEFLTRVLRLKGVRIDREHFLRSELHRRGMNAVVIERAVAENPVSAGVGIEMLDRIAADVVEFETRKSTAMSFAAGVPGGFAMLGTIPADITQFYVHAFRIMQKVAYVYGWTSFLEDTDEADDETLGKLAAFLGVMMGVGGASVAVTNFAASVARPAVQKQIAGIALTKTVWYTPMKQVLRVIGVKLTKDSFAKTVAKTVPLAGGVVSGGLTYATLRVQSGRLIKHLRQLPPPHVDAEQYLGSLHAVDAADGLRKDGSFRSRVKAAAGSRKQAGSGEQESGIAMGARKRALCAARGTDSAMKSVASSTSRRAGSLLSRRQAESGTEQDDESLR